MTSLGYKVLLQNFSLTELRHELINQTVVLSLHIIRPKTLEGPAGVGFNPGSFANNLFSFSQNE